MTRNDKIQADFEELIRKNPEVYRRFEEITFSMINRGFKNWSARGAVEVLRWQTALAQGDGSRTKISNNYTSRLSRLFAERNPEHAGFYRQKLLREESLNSETNVEYDYGAAV